MEQLRASLFDYRHWEGDSLEACENTAHCKMRSAALVRQKGYRESIAPSLECNCSSLTLLILSSIANYIIVQVGAILEASGGSTSPPMSDEAP